jgi:hypothetical protein
VFDLSKSYFKIKEKSPEQRRVQEPVFEQQDYQYEFYSDEGSERFRYYQLATTVFGINRFMREQSRTMMTLGDPEKMKRFATADPMMYLLGIARPLKTTDPMSAMLIHQKNISKELKSLETSLEK